MYLFSLNNLILLPFTLILASLSLDSVFSIHLVEQASQPVIIREVSSTA